MLRYPKRDDLRQVSVQAATSYVYHSDHNHIDAEPRSPRNCTLFGDTPDKGKDTYRLIIREPAESRNISMSESIQIGVQKLTIVRNLPDERVSWLSSEDFRL